MLSCLALPRLSSRLVFFCLVSSLFLSCNCLLSCLVLSCLVLSCLVLPGLSSRLVFLFSFVSSRLISSFVLPCFVLPGLVSRLVSSRLALTRLLSYLVLSSLVSSRFLICLILSCFILYRLLLSCLLSHLVLSRLALQSLLSRPILPCLWSFLVSSGLASSLVSSHLRLVSCFFSSNLVLSFVFSHLISPYLVSVSFNLALCRLVSSRLAPISCLNLYCFVPCLASILKLMLIIYIILFFQDKRVVGATCSTDGAAEYHFQRLFNPTTARHVIKCECKGLSTVPGFAPSGGSMKCIIHYWECPLFT